MNCVMYLLAGYLLPKKRAANSSFEDVLHFFFKCTSDIANYFSMDVAHKSTEKKTKNK